MEARSGRDGSGRAIRDAALIAGALLAALAVFLFLKAGTGPVAAADTVLIRVDGEEVARHSLLVNAELPVDTKYGHNLLVIADGEAWMEEADCPDGYCMRQNHVRFSGDTVICLPHRLVIEAVSLQGSPADGGSGHAEEAGADGGPDPSGHYRGDVDAVAS